MMVASVRLVSLVVAFGLLTLTLVGCGGEQTTTTTTTTTTAPPRQANCFCGPPPNSALLVIDMQNDFLDGGSLEVPRGRTFIPTINELANMDGWASIGYSLDYHPHNSISFASSHEGAAPFDIVELTYDVETGPRVCGSQWVPKYGVAAKAECTGDNLVKVNQSLWPDHCVQNTVGMKLDNDVVVPDKAFEFKKGYTTVVDSYSAFNSNLGDESTNLRQILEAKGVKNIFIVGVAQDFCVHFTAKDGMARGFTSYILEDVTAPVSAPGLDDEAWGIEKEKANKKNRDAGVTLLKAENLKCGCGMTQYA